MKFNSRLRTTAVNLRNISASHTDGQLIEPKKFVCHIRNWFQHFVLPLYPKSPKEFLAIQFLLEILESEIPATTASCSRFVELIEQFSDQDRNHFISSISDLINDLVIHRHPEWLDLCEGDYEQGYFILGKPSPPAPLPTLGEGSQTPIPLLPTLGEGVRG